MLPSERSSLLDRLAENILETNSPERIEESRSNAYFLIASQTINSKPQNYEYWLKKWKRSVKPELSSELDSLKKSFKKVKLPIFDLLNSLSLSKIHVVVEEKEEIKKMAKLQVRLNNPLPESILVQEIMHLLLGGYSKILTFDDDGVLQCSEYISNNERSALDYISKLVKCMRLVTDTRDYFQGTIGNALREVIDIEYHQLVNDITALETDNLTLFHLITSLSGAIYEKCFSQALFCYAIQQNIESSALNTLLICQNHGNPQTLALGSKLIDAGIEKLLIFIRDWIAFGSLNDDYEEFFIFKVRGKIKSEDWWNNKYILIEDKIPKFLNDKGTIRKILNSGRARNFINKHSDSSIQFVDNFGSTAPFAINLNPEKNKKKKNRLRRWIGPKFDLSMVSEYYNEAVNSMRYMMFEVVWIEGHLLTVRDFILFARGDFAVSLYKNFEETTDEEEDDAAKLFNKAMEEVCKGINYTNKTTRERLNDRIDLADKWQIKPTADEVRLTYLTNPPVNIFLTKEILAEYFRMGRFIWKLKLACFRLAKSWRISKYIKVLKGVGLDANAYQKMSITRHLMLVTLTTIVEYISTDIILCRYSEMIKELKEATDFDDMVEIHKCYLNDILTGTFQNEKHSNVNVLVLKLVDTSSKFTDIVQELDTCYIEIVNYASKHKRLDTIKGKAFIQKQTAFLSDIKDRVTKLYETFNKQLGDLYTVIYDDMLSKEMQYLENRLRLVCVNIQ